jgi:hypothetical protein
MQRRLCQYQAGTEADREDNEAGSYSGKEDARVRSHDPSPMSTTERWNRDLGFLIGKISQRGVI